MIFAILAAGFFLLPAFGQRLEDMMQQALKDSPRIKNLELAKDSIMLSIRSNELKNDKVSYTVRPSGSYVDNHSTSLNSINFGQSGNDLVSITIPGSHTAESAEDAEDTTVIGLGAWGGLEIGDSGPAGEVGASAGIAHTFLFGNYDELAKQLNNRKLELGATQTFERGKNSFLSSLLSYVRSSVAAEKKQAQVTYEKKKLEETVAHGLELQEYDKTSLTYKSKQVQVKSYEGTLESLRQQLDSLQKQFEAYAGFSYVPLDPDDIAAPALAMPEEVQKSLSYQIAELKLQLAQADYDQYGIMDKRTNMAISGKVSAMSTPGYYYTYTGTDGSEYQVFIDDGYATTTGSVGLQYNGRNWSLGGNLQANVVYDDAELSLGTTSLTLSGSFSNDVTTSRRKLELETARNTINVAQLDLEDLQRTEANDWVAFSDDVADWQFSYEQQKNTLQLDKENLTLQESLQAHGLADQSTVDDAAQQVTSDRYDLMLMEIDGYVLALKVDALML
jgi:hypothetical protein